MEIDEEIKAKLELLSATIVSALKENGNKQGSQELYDKIAILDKELE